MMAEGGKIVKKPRKVKADFPEEMLPTKAKSTGKLKKTSVVKFNAVKNAYNDILMGATDSMVINKLVDDVYEVGKAYTEGHARHVLAEAKQLIIQDMETELRDIRIGLMAKAYDTYTDAREHGDRTNAIAALNFISKITGALDPRYGQTNVQNITIDFHFDDNNDEEYEEVE